MKISYLFPIFKEDDAKSFFEKFLDTAFFRAQKSKEIYVYVEENDQKNLKVLKSFSKKSKSFKIKIEKESFTYNSIFKKSIGLIKGDVLLLGDLKVKNLELLFAKCLEKKDEGANIVFVKKRYKGIKNFFVTLKRNFYNFFIKIFTGKKDRFNILSLGLYDKDVLDVLRALIEKSLFLKNTKDIFGFHSKTLYIDEKVKTYQPLFFKKTLSLIMAFASLGTFFLLLILTVLLNIFSDSLSIWYNIFAIFGCLLTLSVAALFFPKHFFDIRNDVKSET